MTNDSEEMEKIFAEVVTHLRSRVGAFHERHHTGPVYHCDQCMAIADFLMESVRGDI